MERDCFLDYLDGQDIEKRINHICDWFHIIVISYGSILINYSKVLRMMLIVVLIMLKRGFILMGILNL